MKKNFLLAMFVMLMTSISSFAQKEYNMVITLNNGTTVTLGHNDIKEITFNDGAVSISGNMVNTIDSLANVTNSLDKLSHEIISYLDYKTEEIEEVTKENRAKIESLETVIDEKIYSVRKEIEDECASKEDVQKLYDKINALEVTVAALKEAINKK